MFLYFLKETFERYYLMFQYALREMLPDTYICSEGFFKNLACTVDAVLVLSVRQRSRLRNGSSRFCCEVLRMPHDPRLGGR